MPAQPAPRPRVILLRSDAPDMPAPGQACNGCGVCCAEQPCPLGMLVSGRRHGRCRALGWNARGAHYRCRMINEPATVLRWLPVWMSPLASRLARRLISAASGCDARLVTERPAP